MFDEGEEEGPEEEKTCLQDLNMGNVFVMDLLGNAEKRDTIEH